MHSGNGRMLRPQLRIGIPAGIEENKNGPNMVAGSNFQKTVNPLLESCRILLPEQVVQKHAHGVHAQTLGPCQFFVYLLRVKAGGLPHLQLVDGIGGREIASHQPGLLLVPGFSFSFRPALRLRAQGDQRSRKHKQHKQRFRSAHRFPPGTESDRVLAEASAVVKPPPRITRAGAVRHRMLAYASLAESAVASAVMVYTCLVSLPTWQRAAQ